MAVTGENRRFCNKYNLTIVLKRIFLSLLMVTLVVIVLIYLQIRTETEIDRVLWKKHESNKLSEVYKSQKSLNTNADDKLITRTPIITRKERSHRLAVPGKLEYNVITDEMKLEQYEIFGRRNADHIFYEIQFKYQGCCKQPSNQSLHRVTWANSGGVSVAGCLTLCSTRRFEFCLLSVNRTVCLCESRLEDTRIVESPGCSGLNSDYFHIHRLVRLPERELIEADSRQEPKYIGCYSNQESLTNPVTVPAGTILTPNTCLSLCKEKHSTHLLINSTNCFCRTLPFIDIDLFRRLSDSLCDYPCSGIPNSRCGSDSTLGVYKTDIATNKCRGKQLVPRNSQPPVGLISFPGSGNTWVRNLVEIATGVYTGSFYSDGTLFGRGFRGETEPWLGGTTIAVKSHAFEADHIAKFRAAVLIIRNPYEAIVSEHNRKFAGHTGSVRERSYSVGSEWADFVLGKSRSWTNTAMMWLEFCPRVLVVYFEDLKADLSGQLRRILGFLGREIDLDRFICALLDGEGQFKRPTSADKFDPFTDDMKAYIDIYIKIVAIGLKLKGHPPMPESYAPRRDWYLDRY